MSQHLSVAEPRSSRGQLVALVTGCSSGIGRATALALLRAGYHVYATARRRDDLAELEVHGCSTLALDVTSEESMRAAIDAVHARHGALDLLVNNAGYGQSGVVEEVEIGLVRKQFETNVFGAMRLAQLVLPAMRERSKGRIVNVSSMGGRLTFPYFGVYHASKYALEALSDALRFEVAGFGVKVVLVEPGIIRTNFGRASMDSNAPKASAQSGPYADFGARMTRATAESYENKGALAALAGTPEDVAQTIVKAARAGRPRARYTVSPSARLLLFLRRVLPDGLWDAFLRAQYPAPRALSPNA